MVGDEREESLLRVRLRIGRRFAPSIYGGAKAPPFHRCPRALKRTGRRPCVGGNAPNP